MRGLLLAGLVVCAVAAAPRYAAAAPTGPPAHEAAVDPTEIKFSRLAGGTARDYWLKLDAPVNSRLGEVPVLRLTCSIGVAASDTLGVWGEQLIAHADAAVYAAKRAGRNQLFVAQSGAA